MRLEKWELKVSEEWSLTPADSGSEEWSTTPPSASSQDSSPIPQKSIRERVSGGLKEAGNIMFHGLTGASSEGTMKAVAGGPQNSIADAIKRYALDKAIPSNDNISSSLKNALVEGTNPVNILMAMEPAESINALRKRIVNFGGNKALNEVAYNTKVALTAANEAFKQSYDELFSKVGSNMIPEQYKNSILMKAADSLEQTSPNSLASKFLDTTLPSKLGENIDVKQLHALKGEVFKTAKSMIGVEKNALMKVYNSINEVLASDKLGGQKYAELTAQQNDFFNNESNYIKRLIQDPINKNNITSQRLSTKQGITGQLGIKTPIKLQENYRVAFEKLSNRPSSPTNVLQELEAVRRGTILKRAAIGGAMALASPDVRKAILAASHLAS